MIAGIFGIVIVALLAIIIFMLVPDWIKVGLVLMYGVSYGLDYFGVISMADFWSVAYGYLLEFGEWIDKTIPALDLPEHKEYMFSSDTNLSK